MKENKELNAHVKAIGEWAAESKKRVVFVVCGEITEDGIDTTNALVGRNDRIARALFGNAKKNDGFKHVITIASEAIKSPITGMLLCAEASKDEDCDGRKQSDSLADALKNLVDDLKDKIRKND